MPNRCQYLNIFVWKPHKYWVLLALHLIQTPCSYNIIVKYWLFFVDFYIHNIQISCLIHSFRPNRYHTGITVFLLDRHTYMVLTPCITAHKNYNSHFIISLLSFLTIRTINTGNISGLPTPPVTLRFSFPTKTQKPASSNSFKFSDKHLLLI